MKSQPIAIAVNSHIKADQTLDSLMQTVRACRVCEAHLPLGPRPVLQAGATAKILIVGQAPSAKVHAMACRGTIAAANVCAVGWVSLPRPSTTSLA